MSIREFALQHPYLLGVFIAVVWLLVSFLVSLWIAHCMKEYDDLCAPTIHSRDVHRPESVRESDRSKRVLTILAIAALVYLMLVPGEADWQEARRTELQAFVWEKSSVVTCADQECR